MAKRVMSRKDMFLAYKRELCSFDGVDGLIDPEWTYLADYDLFTSHKDAEWIPIMDGKDEAGFMVVLKGELVKDHDVDYFIWDTYTTPSHRRKGLMKEAVTDYISKHPGKYGLVMMDKNTPSHLFWEATIGEFDEVRSWVWPGCHLFIVRKEEE